MEPLLFRGFLKCHGIVKEQRRHIENPLQDKQFQSFFPDKVHGTITRVTLISGTPIAVLLRCHVFAGGEMQLASTVGAVQQIRKDALFAILRFRRTALCPLDDLLLHLLKGVPVDNRLVNILEDCGSAIIVPTLKLAMCFFQELGQSVKPP